MPRDSTTLTDSAESSPRAHALLAVDVVTLALVDNHLQARLVEVGEGPFAGRWAFPGSLVAAHESLQEVAARELNVSDTARVHLEQLRTFGDPKRDPKARIVSTAYLALVPDIGLVGTSERYPRSMWQNARALPRLAYDHAEMAREAFERLCAKLGYTNIVRYLLPREFTMSELQSSYEAILDRRLDRRNFRKKLIATDLLETVGRKRGGAHRPAALYRFRDNELVTVDIL